MRILLSAVDTFDPVKLSLHQKRINIKEPKRRQPSREFTQLLSEIRPSTPEHSKLLKKVGFITIMTHL